jgi:hypothetical protein
VIEVTLTKEEMQMAALVGVARHWESWSKGHKTTFGLDPDASLVSLHIDGAMGEVAVAKALGRYWSAGVNIFKGPDLGERVQVRTRSRHDYDLLVRPGDKSDHAYIHVTGSAPVLRVWGWVWGHEAKQPEWLREHGGRDPAYFVPADELRKMRTEGRK